MLANDRIERDVFIAADAARVWAVLTEPEHIGMWFGNGEPVEIDLRPGGRVAFDHGDRAKLAAVIEHVDALKSFSFRWAAGEAAGAEPAAKATRVEFTLTPEGAGTRLRVVESGFGKVEAEDPALIERRYKANASGWRTAIRGLAAYLERPEDDATDGLDDIGIEVSDHDLAEFADENVFEEVDAA